MTKERPTDLVALEVKGFRQTVVMIRQGADAVMIARIAAD